jgi:hypothetical protein
MTRPLRVTVCINADLIDGLRCVAAARNESASGLLDSLIEQYLTAWAMVNMPPEQDRHAEG